MCKKCDTAEISMADFENSIIELEEYQSWLESNPDGSLDDFRQSDDWTQIYLDLTPEDLHEQKASK